MLLALQPNWWDDWQLYHACTFDGAARRIIVNPGFTTISVQRDIYSAWKEWARLRDNTKFLPAIRTIGGDPVGGGQKAGDIYFLQNDWQIVVNEAVLVQGVLYHDDGLSPFVITPGGGVTSTVSNLVQTAETSTNVITGTPEEIAAAVWVDMNAVKPAVVSEAVWDNIKALTVAKFLGLK